MIRLILPTIEYKESFLTAWKECEEEADSSYTFATEEDIRGEVEQDFETFLKKEEGRMEGKFLPEGYVPQTHWWLVDDDEVIGEVSLRHYLNENLRKNGGHIGYGIRPGKRGMGYGKKILELGLKEAKKMGLEKILITCDITNVKSQKVIEANGGILEDVIPNPGHPDKMRWWIDLSTL